MRKTPTISSAFSVCAPFCHSSSLSLSPFSLFQQGGGQQLRVPFCQQIKCSKRIILIIPFKVTCLPYFYFFFFDEGILSIYVFIWKLLLLPSLMDISRNIWTYVVDEVDFLVFISSSTNKTSNLQQFINDSKGEIKEVWLYLILIDSWFHLNFFSCSFN